MSTQVQKKPTTGPAHSSLKLISIQFGGLGEESYSSEAKPGGENRPMCKEEAVRMEEKIGEGIKKPRVVILGGGVAGLAAGYRLHSCGLTETVVVEAKGRPGGRVHTCKLGAATVELGADSFPCTVTDVGYRLACLLGLERVSPTVGPSLYVRRGGQAALEGAATDRAIREQLERSIASREEKIEESVEEMLRAGLGPIAERLTPQQRNHLEPVLASFLAEINSEWGESASKVSAEHFAACPAPQAPPCRPLQGMNALLQYFLKGIPTEKIKLNKRVENVQWNEKWGERERAVVRCEDGEELKAEFVVVTLPLGVLKCNHERMFCPQLPYPKAKAIGRLGFGHLTRIYMRYDKPFWCGGEGRLRVALSEDLWPGGVCPVDEVAGDHVLCFALGGAPAAQAENHTDTRIAELLTLFMRRALDDPALPPPVAIARSGWNKDEDFLGGRVYLCCGCGVKEVCEVGRPVPGPEVAGPPVLLFGGEATAPGHQGTLHGAILSGLREADRIISITRAFKGVPSNC